MDASRELRSGRVWAETRVMWRAQFVKFDDLALLWSGRLEGDMVAVDHLPAEPTGDDQQDGPDDLQDQWISGAAARLTSETAEDQPAHEIEHHNDHIQNHVACGDVLRQCFSRGGRHQACDRTQKASRYPGEASQ